MVSIEELYKNFGVLADAKDKAGEHQAEYLSFIDAVKGGAGEKRLASQFITRFFKFFPDCAAKAVNALFDLCEDNDVNIRKQAIKDLPNVCKVQPEQVTKISGALTQLLVCEDQGEISLVQSSILSLFAINAKGTLQGLFDQIVGDHEEDDVLRDRVLKFLTTKLKTLSEETLDKDAEEFVLTSCKKVLEDVTKDEFIMIMDLLRSLRIMKTVQSRQSLVEIVTTQAELDEPLDLTDAESVDRLIQCIKTASPLFSKNVHSKVFVEYICDHVLPNLSDITSPEGGNIQLDILKILSEISEFAGEIDEPKARIEKLYNRLIAYMPLPPSEENDAPAAANEEPKLEFSYVECLMFSFHQLCSRCPGFLTDEDNADRLKDFRLRLQYFARGVQIYIKQLRAALQGKSGETLKTDENKIKVVALKITSNINTLIKDLFHNPPTYKVSITLSWKPITQKAAANPVTTNTATAGQKRINPITFESNGAGGKKVNKNPRELYSPPGGKFSEKAANRNRGGSGGGGYRGRGGGRNRGRGFRRY
ncbi:apoptosis inhibitor 5 isoform X2 [Patella vulgata]|uniref:apoptosis inhibitor 5 isoform X2 n=1 Tax=Patella vulgata TaxID=6465 RepID=UPI0021806A5E|nr:apoptosis inhibitor 5 isoform X2 [Patella vulgata]